MTNQEPADLLDNLIGMDIKALSDVREVNE